MPPSILKRLRENQTKEELQQEIRRLSEENANLNDELGAAQRELFRIYKAIGDYLEAAGLTDISEIEV